MSAVRERKGNDFVLTQDAQGFTHVSYEAGRVDRIEERFVSRCVSGVGKDAMMEQKSIGWFVVLDTGAAFGVGSCPPASLQVGATAYVEFR